MSEGTPTNEALIARIAGVAAGTGWASGVSATEIAGQIVSCLAKDTSLIARFMAEGPSLVTDGVIATERGLLTYMAANGNIYTPEFLARHQIVKAIERTALQSAKDHP